MQDVFSQLIRWQVESQHTSMTLHNAGVFRTSACALTQQFSQPIFTNSFHRHLSRNNTHKQCSQTVPHGQPLECYLGQPAKDVLCRSDKAWLPVLAAQHQVGSCCLFIDSRGLPADVCRNMIAIFMKQFIENRLVLCP